jgi:hypothetical protein
LWDHLSDERSVSNRKRIYDRVVPLLLVFILIVAVKVAQALK